MPLVICDRAEICDHSSCTYNKPVLDAIIPGVMCGYCDEEVNILEADRMEDSNPNLLFRFKKEKE